MFYNIDLYFILFCLILFSPVIRINAALILHCWSNVDTWKWVRVITESIISPRLFMVPTMLHLLIFLSDVLIYWIFRTIRVLTVSYAAETRRRLHGDFIFPFNMTIGSVVLISSISVRTLLAFVINYISSSFEKICLSSRKAKLWVCAFVRKIQFS